MANPNVFAHPGLDRAALRRADEVWLETQWRAPESRLMLLHRGMPLVSHSGKALVWHSPSPRWPWENSRAALVFLGMADERAHFALELGSQAEADEAAGEANAFLGLRHLAATLDGADASTVCCAKALFDWHRSHRFCGSCGHLTIAEQAGWRRACPQCQTQHFPRTDPVVIMLPIHGDVCLLGRQSRHPKGMFSALAGFVEPGESLEAAVRREVAEESGLEAEKVTFFSDQPWPFPYNLMLGFFARVSHREFVLDGHELEAARWVTRAEAQRALAMDAGLGFFIPPPLAIAHHLIRAWANGDDV
jgi:NAD+ diphosphatase